MVWSYVRRCIAALAYDVLDDSAFSNMTQEAIKWIFSLPVCSAVGSRLFVLCVDVVFLANDRFFWLIGGLTLCGFVNCKCIALSIDAMMWTLPCPIVKGLGDISFILMDLASETSVCDTAWSPLRLPRRCGALSNVDIVSSIKQRWPIANHSIIVVLAVALREFHLLVLHSPYSRQSIYESFVKWSGDVFVPVSVNKGVSLSKVVGPGGGVIEKGWREGKSSMDAPGHCKGSLILANIYLIAVVV